MTVNSQQNKISYVGNGVATEFAIPFSYLDKSHLSVWQMLNGVQSERTDWTAADGTLIFKTAPENNAQIVIMRQVPLTQETDYRENEILPAETLERCFDKLTMQVQQLEEKSGRAVTVDVFDDTNAASLIPSIRKAVSDCNAAAVSARANAEIATIKAQIATDKASEAENTLSLKSDVDLSNLTTNGKKNLADMLMPDYSRKVVLTAGVTYTASCAGVFCGYYRGTAGTGTTYTVNGFTQTYAAGFDDNARPSGASFFVFVSKGESYSAARANNLYFIPLKGVAA